MKTYSVIPKGLGHAENIKADFIEVIGNSICFYKAGDGYRDEELIATRPYTFSVTKLSEE